MRHAVTHPDKQFFVNRVAVIEPDDADYSADGCVLLFTK
jgi:hypothetical protein